jgi:Protein of unknown function (DUF3253)
MSAEDNFKKDILALLSRRPPGKTICPSEVLEKSLKQDKEMMKAVRASAVELAHQGIIVITQKGLVVDPDDFKGPIRLMLKTNNS